MSEFVLAIDVGGTKTLVGTFDRAGQPLSEWTTPTRHDGDESSHIVEFARSCLTEFRTTHREFDRMLAVGAGFPEYVSADGMLTSHEVLSWRAQPLAALTDAFANTSTPIPIVVESDVRLGAIGEAVFGAGLGLPSFFYVSLGTGVSSAFVMDADVWQGARGEAIGLGEHNLDLRADVKLEAYASGAAIEARYLADAGIAVRGTEISARARTGDPVAQQIVTSAGDALGTALSDVAQLLDPHAIVLGGGLGETDNPVTSTLRKRYESRLSRRPGGAPLLHARLGPRSALIGAAVVAHRATGSR